MIKLATKNHFRHRNDIQEVFVNDEALKLPQSIKYEKHQYVYILLV